MASIFDTLAGIDYGQNMHTAPKPRAPTPSETASGAAETISRAAGGLSPSAPDAARPPLATPDDPTTPTPQLAQKGPAPEAQAATSDSGGAYSHQQQTIIPGAGYRAVPPPGGGALGKAAGVAGQFAAGANRSVAGTIGALPDAVGYGLTKLGVPGIKPGYFTDLAQRGINTLAGGQMPPPQGQVENLAYGAGHGIADAAGVMLPAGALKGVLGAASPVAGGVANALTKQPVAQVLSGALGGAVGQASGSPLLGTAASLAPIGAGLLAKAAVSPAAMFQSNNAERQRLVGVLRDAGVPMSPGQETGSGMLRLYESVASQFPGSSSVMADAASAQNKAFTAAAAAKAGMPGATSLTPDVLNQMTAGSGGMIGDITAAHNIPIDKGLIGSLQAQATNAPRYLGADAAKALRSHISDFINTVQPTAGGGYVVPGPAFQQFDSALGDAARSSMDGYTRKALGSLRDQLGAARDAALGPTDAADLAQAKRQYANAMVLQDAMNRPSAGTAVGHLSPAALASAANSNVTDNFARGRGDLRDLGAAGQAILKDPIPNSGTAPRMMMLGALSGALMHGDPMMAVHLGAGAVGANLAQRAYMSSLMRAYLTNQLASGIPDASPGLLAGVAATQGRGLLQGQQMQ